MKVIFAVLSALNILALQILINRSEERQKMQEKLRNLIVVEDGVMEGLVGGERRRGRSDGKWEAGVEENARWDGSKRRSGRRRAGGRNTVEWSLEGREEEVGMEGIGGEESGNQRFGMDEIRGQR